MTEVSQLNARARAGEEIKFFFCPFYFLFGHIINNLLTELGRSVWENLDLERWYRPHCVRSLLATLVKILPYRPPARLIRTKTDGKLRFIARTTSYAVTLRSEMFAGSMFLFLTADILQEYVNTKTLGLWRGDWLHVSFAKCALL